MSNDQTTPSICATIDTHHSDINATWHDSQAIIQAYPDYLFWKKKKGAEPQYIYRGCNHHFAELVGLSDPTQIVGLTDWDLPWQPAGHRPGFFQKGDEDTFTGQKAITNQMETLVLPHQPPRLLSVTKRALCDQAGKIIGVLGVARDVTASINTNALVRNLLEQDHWQQTTQRERLSLLTHRLRTPLNGLVIGCDTLHTVLKGNAHHVMIKGMQRASHALLAQVNQLIAAFLPHEIPEDNTVLTESTITPMTRRTPRVLIVEDDELTQYLLLRLFKSQGVHATLMPSAESALTACLETSFDLIITDINLPGQSGVQLAEHIKQLSSYRQPKRLVGISAHMQATLQQACLKAGMHAAFQKPLSHDQVKALLNDVGWIHQRTQAPEKQQQQASPRHSLMRGKQ